MSRYSNNRKFSVFYAIFFAFIAVFLIALFAVCRFVNGWLADYESSLPKYVAEEVFDKFYLPLTSELPDSAVAALIKKSGISTSEYENTEILMEYIISAVSGKTLSYTESSAGIESGKIRYIVRISENGSDVKLSTFTLCESGESSKYGSPLYELDGIELFCKPTESVSVIAPADYTVYINGIAANDSTITETNIASNMKYVPDSLTPVTYTKRDIKELYQAPEIKVLAPDGRESPITLENGVYTAELLYSDTIASEMTEYVLSAARALSAYMQNDMTFYSCSKYLEKGTELYEATRTSETYWVIDHNGYSFEDESASEFYAYDSNTFSCRVKHVHILKSKKEEDYRDYIDMTLFFRRADENSEYLIFDRTNN